MIDWQGDSMVEIKEVHEDLLPAVKQFLTTRSEFRYRTDWNPVFTYDWKLQQHPYGYCLLDNGKIAGFVATIFAERVIKNEKAVVCNIGVWVVDKKCPRGSGRALLGPLFEMKDIAITTFAPNFRSKPAFEKLGFRPLDQTQLIIPVWAGLLPQIRNHNQPEITFDKEAIYNRLTETDRKIFDDHCNLACVHFLISDKTSDQYCYIIATTSARTKFKLFGIESLNLCYLSNADIFANNFHFFSRLLFKTGINLIRYDSRLISRRLSRFSLKVPRVRLFYSDKYGVNDIDNIYSELVTFDTY
jgi:hypothetical protein